MSLNAHLVAMKSKELLTLGKLVRGADDRFESVYYGGGITEEVLAKTIMKFMIDHIAHDTRLLDDNSLYELDLAGFVRVNDRYGLPFDGPMECTMEDFLRNNECQ